MSEAALPVDSGILEEARQLGSGSYPVRLQRHLAPAFTRE